MKSGQVTFRFTLGPKEILLMNLIDDFNKDLADNELARDAEHNAIDTVHDAIKTALQGAIATLGAAFVPTPAPPGQAPVVTPVGGNPVVTPNAGPVVTPG